MAAAYGASQRAQRHCGRCASSSATLCLTSATVIGSPARFRLIGDQLVPEDYAKIEH